LRGLLEYRNPSVGSGTVTNVQNMRFSDGKTAIQIVGDFLRCVLEYLHSYFEGRKCTFIVPNEWSEIEIGRYAEAIQIAIPKENFRVLNNIEAGAFWMVRKLQSLSRKSGVVLLKNSEGLIVTPYIIC
jgi:hypothetical protein